MKDVEVKYLGIAADLVRNVYLLHFELRIINPEISNHKIKISVGEKNLYLQTGVGKTEKLTDYLFFYYAEYKESQSEIVKHDKVKELIKNISPSITVTYNIFNEKHEINGNNLKIGDII